MRSDDAPAEPALPAIRKENKRRKATAKQVQEKHARVKQAQYIAGQPNPNEPLGFSGSLAQATGMNGASAGGLRPSGPPITGDGPVAPSGPMRRDDAVHPAQFYSAQQPNPNEPLGFSGSLMQGGGMGSPAPQAGIFDEEPQPEIAEDPYDLDAPAPTISSSDWLRSGRWYTQQSAVYMSRENAVRNWLVLGFDFSSSALPHYQNFLQIPVSMGFQPGIRSTIGRYWGRDDRNRDHSAEFTYLGLGQFHTAGSITAVSNGGIFTAIDPSLSTPAYTAANTQSFAQTSNFNSFELNYRIERRLMRDKLVYTRDSTWVREAVASPLPAVFAGLRVLTINEKLAYLSSATASLIANGTYDVKTTNNLIGPQVGMDWFYEHTDWRAGIRLKSGALVNWASQTSQVFILDANGNPLVPNRNEHASSSVLGFVGEFSVITAYRFTPNFSLRASYDMIWVTDLALAQNQLTFRPSNPPALSDHHMLLYQGVSLGFEWAR